MRDLYSIAFSILKVYQPDLTRGKIKDMLSQLKKDMPKFHSYIKDLLDDNVNFREIGYDKLLENKLNII